jgi:hypothetical protein
MELLSHSKFITKIQLFVVDLVHNQVISRKLVLLSKEIFIPSVSRKGTNDGKNQKGKRTVQTLRMIPSSHKKRLQPNHLH